MKLNINLKIVPIEIESTTFYVRCLRAKEMISLRDKQESDVGKFIVLMSLCDAEGNRLLDDSEIEEVDNLPMYAFNLIVSKALEVNALSSDAFDAVKKK